ncbi:MAG: hypothetical protein ACTSQF_04575 [Candidatus Heimdallarchaeaceae archaeon]
MSFMLRRVYQGLLFKPDSLHIHPLIGILVIFLQFGFMIVNINWVLGLVLTFVIIENIIFKNIKGALSLAYALLPALVTLGLITYFVGGWVLVYRVLSRLLIGGLGFSLFFSLTNPSDLTRVFEPKALAILIASIIYRSEFLAQSLYFKGFGMQRRTHYKQVKFSYNDLFRILLWLAFVALFTTFYVLTSKGILNFPQFLI